MLVGMTERTASQRGKWSRGKGKRGERELATALRRIWPKAKRGWQTRAGSDDADVVAPYFWWECKTGAKPNPRAALLQAQEASVGSNKLPVAWIRDDKKKAFVVMDFEDFMTMLIDFFGEHDGSSEASEEEDHQG